MTTTITLHWLEQSRSQRIAWLLEELNLTYKLQVYKREPSTFRAEKSLANIHKLGKSPVLEIDNRIICESGLIVEYLISKHGQGSELVAKSEDEDLDIKFSVHHCEGSLQPDLLLLLISQKVRERAPYLLKAVAMKVADGQDEGYALPDLALQLKFLDDKLKENPSGYFVGDHLTAADILYSFPLFDAKRRGYIKEKEHANILQWIEKIRARPAYQKAIEKIKQQDSSLKI